MAARAGVSQRAFHEVFESADECFLAAFEEGLARLSGVVEEAAGRERRWLDRVRAGLVALLGFLEDERGWGRVLMLGAPVEDRTLAFGCEQRVLGVLTALMDDGSPWAIAERTCEPHLTVELLIGGVLSVIRARLCDPEGDCGPLVELTPSLMSFIAVEYLGQAAATRELLLGSSPADQPPAGAVERGAISASCPPIPVTRRTTLALEAIARAPRSSNRDVAAAAGIGDEGQTSHLLGRLAQRGLIAKVPPRSGSRRENAWLLTASGQRVIELLGLASATDVHVSAGAGVRQAA